MQGDIDPTVRVRRTGSSFEEMVRAYSESFGSFEAWRIGKDEPLGWSVDFCAAGKLALVTNNDNGGWRVRTSPDTPESLTLVLPRSGAISLSGLSREVVGTPGKLLFINNHEPELVSVPQGPHTSQSLSVDWSSIAQAYVSTFEAPLIGSLSISQTLDLSDPSATLVHSILQTIHIGINNNGILLQCPIAMANLTEALADVIIRTVPHRSSHLLGRRVHLVSPKHVRRAIDYMHAMMGQPVLVREIAEEAGVSVRALEIGFQTFKGCSPSEFLRGIRLKAARDDLLDPHNKEPISVICLKRGFFHFGRFSASYRAAYGENPSDTRQRRGGGTG